MAGSPDKSWGARGDTRGHFPEGEGEVRWGKDFEKWFFGKNSGPLKKLQRWHTPPGSGSIRRIQGGDAISVAHQGTPVMTEKPSRGTAPGAVDVRFLDKDNSDWKPSAPK